MSKYNNNEELILDGTKIQWHMERVSQWERGERIAPITIDMALTRACNYGCHFCYAMLQENDRSVINKEVITNFLKDSAEIGVKAISFVSDGESTISPAFVEGVQVGNNLGISMAVGTNGFVLTKSKLKEILPHLTYIRINISAGEKKDTLKSWALKNLTLIELYKILKIWWKLKNRIIYQLPLAFKWYLCLSMQTK